MRYGFIGLGHLGAHLAASLVRAGFATTVCDLDRSRAEPLLAAGAGWADAPVALAGQVDAVFTCLPSPLATAAVLGTLLLAMRRGSAWIEMSTNGPEEIRGFAVRAAQHGIATLEAPVTGGRPLGRNRRDHRARGRRRGAVPPPRCRRWAVRSSTWDPLARPR